MYPNLNAEIARKGLTQMELAEMADMPNTTLNYKLNGKSRMTLADAIAIKTALDVDMPLEELFKTN